MSSDPSVDLGKSSPYLAWIEAAYRIHLSPHHVGDGPQMFAAADRTGLEGIVSKRANGRYVSGRTKTWLKIKSFMTADYAVLGVERSSTGIPVALLATLGDRAYVGDAMIALPLKERAEFWAAVERLGTSQSRPAGFGRRKGATWLKGGLVARVRHLRGEAMLRHATLQALDTEAPTSDRRKDWHLLVHRSSADGQSDGGGSCTSRARRA